MSTPVVEVTDLHVGFPGVEAVRGVSLAVHPGECVAIVGESGSGKSVTARTLLGLTGEEATVTAGRLAIEGVDASRFGERQWRSIRGRKVGYVLQDALVSLDSLRPVGREIAETLKLHRAVPRHEIPRKVVDLLTEVGVPEPAVRARQYPHELSGGLRQRALIASAIACGPRLLIADEPTTALDVTVQAQILRLLAERKRAGQALLLISHDLAVVAELADRILVMKDGVVVEDGTADQVLGAPEHPYTKSLLAAIPAPSTRAPRAGEVVIRATGLVKTFGKRTAVDGVSFELRAGQTLGVVGESGSGKTTTARLVLGLLKPDRGSVEIDRRQVQVIYQDPLSSFDPRFSVRRILDEALEVGGVPRRERLGKAVELLEQVGLDGGVLERRPLKLSGGQRQRVAIARALAPNPRVIVCDEPVSALDVSIQAQVLDLLTGLQAELGVAYLFISHHLGVIHHVSDHVLVMKDGQVVESGAARQVLTTPVDPYTKELLAAVPGGHHDQTDPSRRALPRREQHDRLVRPSIG
ncbi:dipeptide ABC transporter ATP-binding protein [Herbidospora sp. RD11066]